jgi:integrase
MQPTATEGKAFDMVGISVSTSWEAGMALEAVQAQAGHVSIESTRIYLHLTDAWLAAEYRRAAASIDADLAAELVNAQAINP